MSLNQSENRILADDIETVCTECGYIMQPGRIVESCAMCGGVVIIVPKGTGERAKADIKERGHSPLAIT